MAALFYSQTKQELRSFKTLTVWGSLVERSMMCGLIRQHTLVEWQFPNTVKKQRIAECPAADIVQSLKLGHPYSTAHGEVTRHIAYLLWLVQCSPSPRWDRNGWHEPWSPWQEDLVALRTRITYELKLHPSFTELLRDVREEDNMIPETRSVKNVASTAQSGVLLHPLHLSIQNPLQQLPFRVFPYWLNSLMEQLRWRKGRFASPEPSLSPRNCHQHSRKSQYSGYLHGTPRGGSFPWSTAWNASHSKAHWECPLLMGPSTSELSPSSFKFEDSLVPAEWKERLCWKMRKMKEVFSCGEFDIGSSKRQARCEDSVLHRTSKSPNKPFRQQLLLPQECRETVLQIRRLDETWFKRGSDGLEWKW